MGQQEPVSKKHRRQIDDLIARIRLSADKLAADKPARGDLKILSRTLRELRYAFKVFAPYRNCRKVTVFGSARTAPEEATYQQAVAFGKAMAERDWMVVTGAAAGIMEAGHVGAGREHSMGLNIMLPFEQEANPVIAGDHKLVNMKYFFTRKLMFVKECDAVVCLPGGFGTLDEALEVLTLLQTGKRDMVPVVLLDAPGGTYWKQLEQFFGEQLLGGGMISSMDSSLYLVTNDCQEAVDEVMDFFTVFHSMRYVHDRLVLRLETEVAPELFDDLNRYFKDLIVEGSLERSEALPEEKGEVDLKDLPRLVFHFNRRSHGRLRQLINSINQGSVPEKYRL
ncbi:MAG: TIGR00730 family Rossman fold protein [Planctomycetaceae bacterium]|nr:TIGR00730 family Rossman fold protein [Planctomycetaceae bacterium]MCP4812941.1 TIGR00730 family Rossman fold protein [Planctomycetaceae bacterium]